MKNYKEMIVQSFPVAVAYIFLGVTFGVLFASKGGSIGLSFIISVTTFAGAAQFLSLEYFGTDFHTLEFFLAIFILNIRHIGYGLTAIKKFGTWDWRKVYMIWGFTDENFGMLQINNYEEKKSIFKIFLINHFYWVFGCTLGAAVGKNINVKGLEFALTSLFIILFFESLKNVKKEFSEG